MEKSLPFQCNLCSSSYKYLQALTAHKMKVHGISVKSIKQMKYNEIPNSSYSPQKHIVIYYNNNQNRNVSQRSPNISRSHQNPNQRTKSTNRQFPNDESCCCCFGFSESKKSKYKRDSQDNYYYNNSNIFSDSNTHIGNTITEDSVVCTDSGGNADSGGSADSGGGGDSGGGCDSGGGGCDSGGGGCDSGGGGGSND